VKVLLGGNVSDREGREVVSSPAVATVLVKTGTGLVEARADCTIGEFTYPRLQAMTRIANSHNGEPRIPNLLIFLMVNPSH
jgi:hypothetical protein